MDDCITLDDDEDTGTGSTQHRQFIDSYGGLIHQNLPLSQTLPPTVTHSLGIRSIENNLRDPAVYGGNQRLSASHQPPISQYQPGSISQGPQIPVFIVPNPSKKASPAPYAHTQPGHGGQTMQQRQHGQVPVQNMEFGQPGQNIQNNYGVQQQSYVQSATNITQQFHTPNTPIPGNNIIHGSGPGLMGSPQFGSGQSTYPHGVGSSQGAVHVGNRRVMMSSTAVVGGANPSTMSTETRTVSTVPGTRVATTADLENPSKAETERFQQQLRYKSTIWSTLYICSTCSHGTNSSAEFIQHLCYAPNHPIPFSCIYCPKTFNPFNQSNEIIEHYHAHSETTIIPHNFYKCMVCSFLTRHKEAFLKHQHDNQSSFQCPYCSMNFPTAEILVTHMEIYKNINQVLHPYKCAVCDEFMPTKKKLHLHMLSAHPYCTNYYCAHCQQTFVSYYLLLEHLESNIYSLYKCDDCNLVHVNMTLMMEHVRVHKRSCSVSVKRIPGKCLSDSVLKQTIQALFLQQDVGQVQLPKPNPKTKTQRAKKSTTKNSPPKSAVLVQDGLILLTCAKCGEKFDINTLSEHSKQCVGNEVKQAISSPGKHQQTASVSHHLQPSENLPIQIPENINQRSSQSHQLLIHESQQQHFPDSHQKKIPETSHPQSPVNSHHPVSSKHGPLHGQNAPNQPVIVKKEVEIIELSDDDDIDYSSQTTNNPICNVQQPLEEQYVYNIQPSHKNGAIQTFQCAGCEFQVFDINGIKTHLAQCSAASRVSVQLTEDDPSNPPSDPKVQILYTCPHCPYDTYLPRDMCNHIKCHREQPRLDQQFSCPHCNMGFIWYHALYDHLLQHNGMTKLHIYKCQFCMFNSTLDALTKEHTLQTHGKRVDPVDSVRMFQCSDSQCFRCKRLVKYSKECCCGAGKVPDNQQSIPVTPPSQSPSSTVPRHVTSSPLSCVSSTPSRHTPVTPTLPGHLPAVSDTGSVDMRNDTVEHVPGRKRSNGIKSLPSRKKQKIVGDITYKCPKCSFAASDIDSLMKHNQTHDQDITYQQRQNSVSTEHSDSTSCIKDEEVSEESMEVFSDTESTEQENQEKKKVKKEPDMKHLVDESFTYATQPSLGFDKRFDVVKTNSNVKAESVTSKRPRGRPPKNPKDTTSLGKEAESMTSKRPHGRPPKNPKDTTLLGKEAESVTSKRPWGRPPLNPKDTISLGKEAESVAPKRPRGRPPKKPNDATSLGKELGKPKFQIKIASIPKETTDRHEYHEHESTGQSVSVKTQEQCMKKVSVDQDDSEGNSDFDASPEYGHDYEKGAKQPKSTFLKKKVSSHIKITPKKAKHMNWKKYARGFSIKPCSVLLTRCSKGDDLDKKDIEKFDKKLCKILRTTTTGDFMIPNEKVFSTYIKCSECMFKTRIRSSLVQHLKSSHTETVPTVIKSLPNKDATEATNDEPRKSSMTVKKYMPDLSKRRDSDNIEAVKDLPVADGTNDYGRQDFETKLDINPDEIISRTMLMDVGLHCRKCDSKSKSIEEARYHQYVHHGAKEQYYCIYCGKKAIYFNELKQHCMLFHANLKASVKKLHSSSETIEYQYLLGKNNDGEKPSAEQGQGEMKSPVKMIASVSLQNEDIEPCSILSRFKDGRTAMSKPASKVVRKYQCNECSFNHCSRLTVQRHVQSRHRSKKAYSCTVCNKQFHTISAGNKHCQVMHKNKKNCLKRNSVSHFKDLRQEGSVCFIGEEQKHMKLNHEKADFVYCGICQKRHLSEEKVKMHVLTKHMNCQPYICTICRTTFTRQSFANYHCTSRHKNMAADDIIKEQELPNIDHTIVYRSGKVQIGNMGVLKPDENRNKYEILQDVNQSFKCNECSFKINSREDMKTHMYTKHGTQNKLYCTICNSFQARYRKQIVSHVHLRHRLKAHGSVIGRLPCPEIETFILENGVEVFKLKDSKISENISTSATESGSHTSAEDSSEDTSTIYECGFCKKSTSKLHAMKMHVIVTHVGAGKFSCKLCGMKPVSSRKLIRNHLQNSHRETSDEYIRENADPELEFIQKEGKIKVTYKGGEIKKKEYETEYQCEVCNKDKIWSKTSISRHVYYAHLGKRAYYCKLCDMSSFSKQGVKVHLKASHKEANENENNIGKRKLPELSFKQSGPKTIVGLLQKPTSKYKCGYCDTTSATAKGKIAAHVLVKHLKIGMYSCKLCNYKPNNNITSMRLHLKNVHCSTNTEQILKSELPYNLLKYSTSDNVTIVTANKLKSSLKGSTKPSSKLSQNHVTVMKKMKFKCEICEKTSKHASVLRAHVFAVHIRVRSLYCKICNFGCFAMPSLKKHILAAHRSITNFSRHVKSVPLPHLEIVRRGNYKVYIIPEKTRKEYQRYNPELVKTKKIEGFTKQSPKTNRIGDTTHGINMYRCGGCDYKSQNQYHVLAHINSIHMGNLTKHFLCTNCKQGFQSKAEVKEHCRKLHSSGSCFTKLLFPLPANVRVKKGKTLILGNVHWFSQNKRYFYSARPLPQKESLERESYACALCKADFTNRSNVYQHLCSQHLNLCAFQCGKCMKSFFSRGGCFIHAKTHKEIAQVIQKIPPGVFKKNIVGGKVYLGDVEWIKQRMDMNSATSLLGPNSRSYVIIRRDHALDKMSIEGKPHCYVKGTSIEILDKNMKNDGPKLFGGNKNEPVDALLDALMEDILATVESDNEIPFKWSDPHTTLVDKNEQCPRKSDALNNKTNQKVTSTAPSNNDQTVAPNKDDIQSIRNVTDMSGKVSIQVEMERSMDGLFQVDIQKHEDAENIMFKEQQAGTLIESSTENFEMALELENTVGQSIQFTRVVENCQEKNPERVASLPGQGVIQGKEELANMITHSVETPIQEDIEVSIGKSTGPVEDQKGAPENTLYMPDEQTGASRLIEDNNETYGVALNLSSFGEEDKDTVQSSEHDAEEPYRGAKLPHKVQDTDGCRPITETSSKPDIMTSAESEKVMIGDTLETYTIVVNTSYDDDDDNLDDTEEQSKDEVKNESQ